MTCPICGGIVRTKQSVKDCEGVYRQRKCVDCDHVFYTTEVESDGSDYRRITTENLNRLTEKCRGKRPAKQLL